MWFWDIWILATWVWYPHSLPCGSGIYRRLYDFVDLVYTSLQCWSDIYSCILAVWVWYTHISTLPCGSGIYIFVSLPCGCDVHKLYPCHVDLVYPHVYILTMWVWHMSLHFCHCHVDPEYLIIIQNILIIYASFFFFLFKFGSHNNKVASPSVRQWPWIKYPLRWDDLATAWLSESQPSLTNLSES